MLLSLIVAFAGCEPAPAPTVSGVPIASTLATPTPDKFGLRAFARLTIASIPEGLVDWSDAGVLAKVFESQAAEADKYPTAQRFSDATAEACHDALVDRYPAWSACLLVPLRSRWVQLNQMGLLLTTSDMAEGYREVAQALREPRP